MPDALSFAFDHAIVNLFPILIAAGLFAWFFGNRLKSLSPITRSFAYAAAGMVGGLLAYWGYDSATDTSPSGALILVSLAMLLVSLILVVPITLFMAKRKAAN